MSSEAPRRTHYRTCNLCEAMCGLAIEVEGERVASVRGDAEDPFSRGYLCPKALGLKDVHEDRDRLRQPVRRVGSAFERVGWDEALDEAAARLGAIQARHGNDAVATYFGNPTVHNYGSMLLIPALSKALGTRSRFSATSVDQLPHHVVAFLLYGHDLLLPVPDIDRTDHLLILGANPAVSNGSLMSAPGVPRRLRAVRARGGAVVVIDPRRTETAALATRHHFIRPGADALLLLALLHTLFAERRAAPGRLAAFVDGLPEVERLCADFAPERVAGPTGLAADDIREEARALSAARSAVVYGRFGVSTHPFGALSQWLIHALNIATGNLDRPGGAMFTRPAIDVVRATPRSQARPPLGRGRTRVRKLPEAFGEYPVAALCEEILTEGPGQIRALLTSAGNPVLSTPNGAALDRALPRLDCMISIDFYINETTRHAHFIFPPTSPLEHDHYDLIFHALAVRNTAKYSPPLFAPPAGALHDWEILLGLASRLMARGPAGGLLARAARAAVRRLSPAHALDAALRMGPYGAGLRRGGLSLGRLREAPHGLDLGPLSPCLPERLATPGRRIRLVHDVLSRDVERARAALDAAGSGAAEAFDLRLIGRRQLRGNNSWMHNSHRLVKGRNRCTLRMHPDDAARRGIAAQQTVRVRSRVGSVEVEVELSDEMMPGVVSLPHGFGHDRPGVSLSTARAHAGVSLNDLTDAEDLDPVCGTAVFSGVPVRVTAGG